MRKTLLQKHYKNLWKYCRNKSTLEKYNIHVSKDANNTDLFNFKVKITNEAGNNSTKKC